MLAIWPNDSAIQNDEAYMRLLLLVGTGSVPSIHRQGATEGVPQSEELNGIEQLAKKLLERNPRSLPHRTLLALARLRQNRAAEALDVYANIQVVPNALTSAALAVHAAVLAANGRTDDAKTETAQIKVDNLLPEEKALIQNLL